MKTNVTLEQTLENAKFVSKQFFELCFQCYGLTPKMD